MCGTMIPPTNKERIMWIERTGTVTRVWFETDAITESTLSDARREAEEEMDSDASEVIAHHRDALVEVLFT